MSVLRQTGSARFFPTLSGDRSTLWAARILFCFACLPLGVAAAQSGSDAATQNCIDPTQPGCRESSSQRDSNSADTPYSDTVQRPQSTNGEQRQRLPSDSVYVDPAGTSTTDPNRRLDDRNPVPRTFPPDPVTDLQRLGKASIGDTLPIFGRDFFRSAPSTFAPGDQLAPTAGYIVGPGDEVLLRLWGPEAFNSQLTVDRSGSIYIPRVGAVHVAGLRFDELERQINTEISRVYRNFNLSVNLGRLRSIEVYVVGEARRPGAYTVSALSSVLNVLFASGGPNVQGSLRHIQVRREGQTLPEFDLYDLVLRGDKSRDVRLQSGDTIYIPAVGPQVVVGGSVRHPAIYELAGETTLDQMLKLAGGLSSTASPIDVRLERIEPSQERHAVTVALDAASRAMPLRDGDVLYANHIAPAYEQSVTIRGNLANPGRFAWHEGMRLSDIIPDRRSLLTSDYWKERNRLGVPTPLFEPMPQNNRRIPVNSRRTRDGRTPDRYTNGTSASGATLAEQAPASAQSADAAAAGLFLAPQSRSTQPSAPVYGQAGEVDESDNTDNNSDPTTGRENYPGDPTETMASPGTLPNRQTQTLDPRAARRKNKIEIPAPEIDWSYAVIERLNPETLKSVLVPFHLGRLVQDHDTTQNLELRPGDVVTILSQDDVLVPQDIQTKYVRLEGEFSSSGVYSVQPGETLFDLVQRAGGLTGKAYLYGSSFQRESARVFQQQRLDEYISSLSADMERASAVRTASSASGVVDPNALAEQRSLINELRQLRATGRVVLEFQPASKDLASIPPIQLENGDTFRVPSKPNTVSVIGAVYGQNVFLYKPDRNLEDYVSLAGNPNRIADHKHAFIIRADGSIFSRERTKGILSNKFDDARINPGDAIVIPEKLVKPTALRQLIDYSQVLSSFGLAAAAVNVVR